MKRTIFIIALFFTCLFVQAQVKEVKPNGVTFLNFSIQGEKAHDDLYARYNKLCEKLYTGDMSYEDFSKEDQEILDNLGEADGGYWDVVGGGCSWYCGGGPYEVTGSSFLTAQAGNTYEPANAHDLDFSTAWVEGAKGDGIGEYVVYHFSSSSPRITSIFVANGYVKSETAWENNGRVKKLKVYYDDKPYAILCLEDSRSCQAFEFPPIGNKRDEYGSIIDGDTAKDWMLKFEILEVYKGKKYDDVAISEIYFDGLDVHCFAKGTLVTMADGSTKPIEELAVGDNIKTYDFENYRSITTTIEKLEKAIHTHLVKYTFSNGKEIIATPDHPFMVRAKGWSSLNPEQTKQYKGFETVNEVKVGDGFFTINNSGSLTPITLTKIEEIHQEQETYTIAKLSEGGNFLVEGFIAGVEELEE